MPNDDLAFLQRLKATAEQMAKYDAKNDPRMAAKFRNAAARLGDTIEDEAQKTRRPKFCGQCGNKLQENGVCDSCSLMWKG